MALRVAVLVKQVPRFDAFELGPDGRLRRDGVELEMNPYCRRAVSKGAELAHERAGGRCTVFTLGPAAAEDTLREAIAWGADDGVLISDAAFAGSDTLATARALAAALRREGPFDLILAGRNSVDADTGQVAPEVAELLDLPFLGGVRELTFEGGLVQARCEVDDGWLRASTTLPVVISCAERLCEPAKVDSDGRAGVDGARIRRVSAADLGPGPWGQEGSPTRVGQVRVLEVTRQRQVLSGTIEAQVAEAVAILRDRGAIADHPRPPGGAGGALDGDAAVAGEPAVDVDTTVGGLTTVDGEPAVAGDAAVGGEGDSDEDRVPPARPPAPEAVSVVAVLLEPGRPRVARELLGTAARLADEIGGRVVAVGAIEALPDEVTASRWGADALVVLSGSTVPEDVARAVGSWCELGPTWALLGPGTMWGREICSRVAARLGAGLTGDAVDLVVEDGRLVAWKPAFGGQLVAAIAASSPTQLATVRPGMLATLRPRLAAAVTTVELPVAAAERVVVLESTRDDEVDDLLRANVVVAVGTGVDPEEYPALQPLLDALGAEMAATRKVTDKGWLPRARQVGITGHSVGPRLYVAVGLSGKFNHMVGARGAGEILAINSDRDAPVFTASDVGIVGDWRVAVPLLVDALGAASRRESDYASN